MSVNDCALSAPPGPGRCSIRGRRKGARGCGACASLCHWAPVAAAPPRPGCGLDADWRACAPAFSPDLLRSLTRRGCSRGGRRKRPNCSAAHHAPSSRSGDRPHVVVDGKSFIRVCCDVVNNNLELRPSTLPFCEKTRRTPSSLLAAHRDSWCDLRSDGGGLRGLVDSIIPPAPAEPRQRV